MSKRASAAAVAAAIKANFAATPNETNPHDEMDGWRRSTFRAPCQTIIALRGLALHNGCTMNDLLLVAIDHLLTAAGKSTVIPVQQDLWGRIVLKGTDKDAADNLV